MYESFFGLTKKPFSIEPNPEFLYWGQAHRLAYAMLEYGIMGRVGFTVITGEIGSGKTTLIRHLLNGIEDDITVGLVSHTRDNTEELLQWIMMALGQPFDGQSYVGLYQRLQDFLIDQHRRCQRTLLIVDEAQNLGPTTLEQLRMLSNMSVQNEQLLELVLVGQPKLKDLLQAPDLVQFSQRVSSDFNIRPLSFEDVVGYINHRLGVAGCHTPLFTADACRLIYEASGGIPRVINILCGISLLYGFGSQTREITAELVSSVIDDRRQFGVFSFDERPLDWQAIRHSCEAG